MLRLSLLTLLLFGVVAFSEPDVPADRVAAVPVTSEMALFGTRWQVEDIDRAGIIDRSMLTIEFEGPDRIAGRAGCNNYFGNFRYAADGIEFAPIGMTRMACAESLMEQEQRFVDALQATVRYEIESETWLVLYDGTGAERIRAIEMTDTPVSEDERRGAAPD